jgi:hypothetical protein
MDGVGEIHRRGATGQRDHLACRRKAEHLIGEHFQLGVL